MHNTLQNYKGSVLMAELSSWNQQEQKFKTLFSDQALEDRAFLKMKLNEYDRIWHKHRDGVQTTDEKALLVMLQYHRSKLQTALYPGLLTRLVVRAYNFLLANIKLSMVSKRPEIYNPPPLVVPDDHFQQHNRKKQGGSYQKKQFNQQVNGHLGVKRNRQKKGRYL